MGHFFYQFAAGPNEPVSSYYLGFRITLGHTQSVVLLWTSDRSITVTSTYTTDRHSYTQQQQASASRPTSLPAQPPGSANSFYNGVKPLS